MSGFRKVLWAAVALYSLFHLGYSLVRYSTIGLVNEDLNRYGNMVEWKSDASGLLDTDAVLHPPFYYLFLLTLNRIFGGGAQEIGYFFYFLQFLLFPLAIYFMVQAASERPRPVHYLLATILTVNFQPFLETLALHKVEGIEFFLICLAVYLFRKKRDSLAGTAVALATHMKYLPGILLVHFLWKRAWKVLLGAGITMLIIGVLSCAAFGIKKVAATSVRHPLDMIFSQKYEGTRPEASVELQSLSGTINRWMAQPVPPMSFMDYIRRETYMPVAHPRRASLIALFLKLWLTGLWFLFFHKHRASHREGEPWPSSLLEFALSLVMIVVLVQSFRVHYGILLLPAFVWTGILLFEKWNLSRVQEKALFAAAYVLSAMLIPGGLLNRLPPHPVWGQEYSRHYLWLSLPFYGYLLLGLSILLFDLRLTPQGPQHE